MTEQEQERKRKWLQDSVIYSDTFERWTECLDAGEDIGDTLVNRYEVELVYKAYHEELWDRIFELRADDETILEYIERDSRSMIESDEEFMLQIMRIVWRDIQKGIE